MIVQSYIHIVSLYVTQFYLLFQAYSPMTVHKWSGLGDGRWSARQLVDLFSAGDDHFVAAKERISDTDILIIDEISMFSFDMLEKLETVMRHVRSCDLPYGGVQIVVVGDFLQLPPVKNYHDPGEYCFMSTAFPVHRILLSDMMRQADRLFIDSLNDIARGEFDDNVKDFVCQLSRPLASDSGTTRLFATNLLADMYNRDCLRDILEMYTSLRQ